ncbi:MAG: hypothetical protein WC856_05675 [Methylococcaceae bacterium]|jgi:hypothetical protein
MDELKRSSAPGVSRFFTVNLVECKVNRLAGGVLYSTVSQAEGNNRRKFSPFGDLKYLKVSKKMAMLLEYL